MKYFHGTYISVTMRQSHVDPNGNQELYNSIIFYFYFFNDNHPYICVHHLTLLIVNNAGPMYYNGVYHLFYQYNPNGTVWGNIVWAHSVSKDLINWNGIEHAIYPSKPFDKFGCWSGSATIIPGKGTVILYTGVIDENNTQVQCYAEPEDPNDPLLRRWVKPDKLNPAVVDKDVNHTEFRDPTTAWWGKDGHWRMLVGSVRKRRGIAYLYRSKDFMTWVPAKHYPFHGWYGYVGVPRLLPSFSYRKCSGEYSEICVEEQP